MKVSDIRKLPVNLENAEMTRYMNDGAKGIHESVLRSYHIVQKVKWLVEQGCGLAVLAELIEEMEERELPH